MPDRLVVTLELGDDLGYRFDALIEAVDRLATNSDASLNLHEVSEALFMIARALQTMEGVGA